MKRYWPIWINKKRTLCLTFLFIITLLMFNIGMLHFKPSLQCHISQIVEGHLLDCNDNRNEMEAGFISVKKQTLKSLQIETRGSFTIIKNYIQPSYQPSYNLTVTLCTQGTYNFLHHVTILCDRWQAPISVAVYAPGQDFYSAIAVILYLRQCGPKCIHTNVTWHMIYDSNHAPTQGIYVTPEDRSIDCSTEPTVKMSYKDVKQLTYPINVARNVARLNVNTYYTFSSDIELYPSLNIVPRFLEMVFNEKLSFLPHIYVLPTFEMKKGFPIPDTKSELVKMIRNDQAVFFHKYACDLCHSFPRREDWLKIIPPEENMSVFHITKGRKAWEPFYVGSNKEPLFNEDFTWEGKNNKISHTELLCFMDYDMYILDNAFLMHSPGIKTPSIVREDHYRRSKYLNHNNKIYKELRRNLRQKYPNRKSC